MARRKLLITGIDGFIGRHLVPALSAEYEILGTHFDLAPSESVQSISLDVTKPTGLMELNDLAVDFKPDVVIHLIGQKLKFCQSNPELAHRINFETTKILVDAIKPLGSKMIFLSSDYVFDGKIGNYKEVDSPRPTLIYGQTKVLSEEYILKNCAEYSIVRTAGVYGPGAVFFEWVKKTLLAGSLIEAFIDAYNTPTYIGDLVWGLGFLARESKRIGIFHIAGSLVVSRYEMITKVAARLKLDPKLVKPIKLEQTEELIARNSSLNSSATSKLLNKKFLDLDEGLSEMFKA